MLIVLIAMIFPTVDARAEVPQDVTTTCGLFDTLSKQFPELMKGKNVDINATLMQFLPLTASQTVLDNESKTKLIESVSHFYEATTQKAISEEDKKELQEEIDNTPNLGVFVTNFLSEIMGGE